MCNSAHQQPSRSAHLAGLPARAASLPASRWSPPPAGAPSPRSFTQLGPSQPLRLPSGITSSRSPTRMRGWVVVPPRMVLTSLCWARGVGTWTLVSGGTMAGISKAQSLTQLGTGRPNLASPRRNKSWGRSTWGAPRAAWALAAGLLDSCSLRGILGWRRQKRGWTVTKERLGAGPSWGVVAQSVPPGFGPRLFHWGAQSLLSRNRSPGATIPRGRVPRRQSQGVCPVSWRLTTETSGLLGVETLVQAYLRLSRTLLSGLPPRSWGPLNGLGRPSPPPRVQLPTAQGPLSLACPHSARAYSAIEMQIFANCRSVRRQSEPDPSAVLNQTFCR